MCDELAIAPTLFYRWQKELFENAHTKDEKIQKLQRKNEVMAELMEAHTLSKKDVGEL